MFFRLKKKENVTNHSRNYKNKHATIYTEIVCTKCFQTDRKVIAYRQLDWIC